MEKLFSNIENTREIMKSGWLLKVPFLPGEEIRVLDKTANGTVCLTNFRLLFYCENQDETSIIPISMIRSVDLYSDSGSMVITTKIGNTFLYVFNFSHICMD